MTDNIVNKLSKTDIIAIVFGMGMLLVIAVAIGGLATYGLMKSQPQEAQVKIVETNNTFILEKNTTILVVPNITEQHNDFADIVVYANGTLEISTTTTTLPSYRIDSNGQLYPEDAEKLMELAMQRLRQQTTTTTTTSTTLFKRISTGPMYRLYNPIDAADFEGQFLINRTVEVHLRTTDGSNRWSYGESPRLEPVSPAEARYYSTHIGENGVEQVLYQMENGTIFQVGEMTW